MRKLTQAEITAKCVEISKCFLDKTTGLHESDLADTINIGNLARVSANIRQMGEITGNKFTTLGSVLKIPYQLLISDVSTQMEELNWISVERKGRRIIRVEEHLPPPEDILSTLGKKWIEDGPEPIDYGTVYSLSALAKNPISEEALRSNLTSESDMDEKQFETTIEYGNRASYLGKFTACETDVIICWTPLYWARNYDRVMRFLQKQESDRYRTLGRLAKSFEKYPGTPDDRILPDEKNLINM